MTRTDSSRFRWLLRIFRFRSMRPDLDAEVDAEIDYHLDRTSDHLVRAGAAPGAAREEARRRFGDLQQHRRRMLRFHRRRGRRERMIALLETIRDGFRDAARSLRATPGVTATVIVTIAIGIGANATMFGIVDRLLLRAPAHVRDPDQVVRIFVDRSFINRTVTSATFPYLDIMDWESAEGLSSIAAVNNIWGQDNLTLGHGESAIRLMGQKASASFFPLLGVRPLHGRFYTEEEDVAGAANVVVLGYDFWRLHFGADPGAIGQQIVLGGVSHEIVGVAPEEFTGIDLQRIDVWMPLRSGTWSWSGWEESRGMYWLRAIGRLAPGVRYGAVEAEATALHRAGRAGDSHYDPEASIRVGSIIAARGINPSDESRVARWLAAVSAIVLLIACANVANILLARGTRRRREVGIRLALGVSGRRLFGQLLLESLLLALLGGLAALLVAWQGTQAVRALLLPDVHWAESPLNLRVLAFTFAVAVITGILAGLAPALSSCRQSVMTILGGSTRGAGVPGARLRAGMLALQTTLSVVLLVGAGLFVKSLASIRALDLGFDPDGVLVAFPELDEEALPREQQGELFADVARRLRAIPSIHSVAVAQSVPFYSSMATDLIVPDVPEKPVFSSGGPYVVAVDAEYFSTMGIRIVRGRGFTSDDVAGAPGVVVVGEGMAAAYWPGESALGKCMKIGGDEAPCSTVVGIAEETARDSLQPQEVAQYYVLVDQHEEMHPNALFLRADPDALAAVAQVARREIEATSPGVRYADVQPLRSLIDPQARSFQLGASMFSAFGALALVIAAVGLYGAIAFNVAQRTHEIGVRSALGADAARLVRMVMRQALWVVAGSLVAGTALAVIAGRWVEPLLFGVRPTDPEVLGVVAVVLLGVAAIAAATPARRAARVDPVEALRVD